MFMVTCKKLNMEVKAIKSKGKQKIVIEKITNTTKKQVTFSKRRSGLFKKSAEWSRLTGSEIAIITFSGAGKVFPFGSPSVDSVIDRYLGVSCGSSNTNNGGSGGFWWDAPIDDSMSLAELEQLRSSLQGLRNQVVSRANELSRNRVVVSTANEMNNASMVMMNLSASASVPQPQGFGFSGFTTDQHSAFVQESASVQCSGFVSSEFKTDQHSAFVQDCAPIQDFDFGVMDQDCAAQDDVYGLDGTESWLDMVIKPF